eukprot:scaffold112089_cov63-Phaeocystis_antarctica.AAC.4
MPANHAPNACLILQVFAFVVELAPVVVTRLQAKGRGEACNIVRGIRGFTWPLLRCGTGSRDQQTKPSSHVHQTVPQHV